MEPGRGTKLKDELLLWWIESEEEFNFWCGITVVSVLAYLSIWVINWMFTTFLNFTGLKYIVLFWIGISFGRMAMIMWEEHKQKKEEQYQDPDEHELL